MLKWFRPYVVLVVLSIMAVQTTTFLITYGLWDADWLMVASIIMTPAAICTCIMMYYGVLPDRKK